MSLPVPAGAASRRTCAWADAGPATASATAEAAETARVLRSRLTGESFLLDGPQAGPPELLLSRCGLRRTTHACTGSVEGLCERHCRTGNAFCQVSVRKRYRSCTVFGMADGPLLRIGELSKRTSASPELLRAWERRYGLLSPARSSGGLRLYASADVARVRLMQQPLAQGLAAGEAAAA